VTQGSYLGSSNPLFAVVAVESGVRIGPSAVGAARRAAGRHGARRGNCTECARGWPGDSRCVRLCFCTDRLSGGVAVNAHVAVDSRSGETTSSIAQLHTVLCSTSCLPRWGSWVMHSRSSSHRCLDCSWDMFCANAEGGDAAANGTSSAGLWALNPVSLAWEAAWLEWQHNVSLVANVTTPELFDTGADDSVRCRHSRICEGAAACSADAGNAPMLHAITAWHSRSQTACSRSSRWTVRMR